MARIFSIHIDHGETMHTAMVSVRETPFHTEYKINMLDDGLMRQLPSDKVLSQQPDHFIFPNINKDQYNEVMQKIINAIAEHIHSLQP